MPASYLYYRHTLPVRIAHWVSAAALAILLMSGLNIFTAHPALYWGKSSYTGQGPVLQIAARDIPRWIMLPESRWLAMARRWHFFFAWVLVINGAFYLGYSVASRHLARDLAPTRDDWRSIGRSVRDHLRLRHPTGEAARRYNVLQKLAYLGVIFLLGPLIVLTGLAMSPWLDSAIPGWVDLLGGRQSARTIHFLAAGLLLVFVLVHVFEVIVGGFWNHLRSMISGRYRIDAGSR